MKIKKEFVVREVADNIVMVPTGKLMNEYSKMFKLNSVSKFIVELLQKNDIDEKEIVKKILEEYEVDEEKAMEDTKKFIQELRKNDMLEN